ncbi:unnamed protein product [Brassicogethes aeneus]|uniref:SUI1 domain-containing protein n=1 Tax=Brassicogethes aeneus TaxID=1431903 RepID=A0A9P0F9Q4_BRAAE|nr:unnamed protein product [Brassicogethes aeneus]
MADIINVFQVHIDFDKSSFLKIRGFFEEFACNGTVIEHPEYGEVLQLQGDQRENICQWLTKAGLAKPDQLKEFACNGTVIEHPEYGEVLQLQGDQRENICQWLTKAGLAKPDQLKQVIARSISVSKEKSYVSGQKVSRDAECGVWRVDTAEMMYATIQRKARLKYLPVLSLRAAILTHAKHSAFGELNPCQKYSKLVVVYLNLNIRVTTAVPLRILLDFLETTW